MKRTKIIATLGPASENPATITRLVEAGVNFFRINSSHASPEDITRQIRLIRRVTKKSVYPVGILLDLGGPKIRVGVFSDGSLQLKEGARITMKVTEAVSDGSFIPVKYKGFYHDVAPGGRVLLDDGKLEVVVRAKNRGVVTAEVKAGGLLKNKKGINLPDSSISEDPITEKDLRDLATGLKEGVEYVALSFVREADDVKRLKAIIRKTSAATDVVAKIERHEAVRNLDSIIDATDAVMIARGDLGVEVPLEQVPIIQWRIMYKCEEAAKPVIVATQMMESMLDSPRPSRADISDVSGAARSYADALMLSGETAVGKYPVESVRAMASATSEVEVYQREANTVRTWQINRENTPELSHAIARAGVSLGEIMHAAGLVVVTESGYMVKRVSSLRPGLPIFAFSRHPGTMRRLTLVRGTLPFCIKFKKELAESLPEMFDLLKTRGLVKAGDQLVVIAGMRTGGPSEPNVVRMETVR